MTVWIESGVSSGGSGRTSQSTVPIWPSPQPKAATEPPPAAPKVTPVAEQRQPAGINLPQSQEGTPEPYICGTVRVDSNVLWWGNDDTEITTTNYIDETGTAQVQTTYRDTIDVMFGICTGPDVHLKAIYGEGSKKIWEGDAGSGVTVLSPGPDGGVFTGGTTTWYSGQLDQAHNAAWDAAIAEPVPNLVGTAYAYLQNGDRANTEVFSFEVQRIPNPLALTALVNHSADGNDVNPMTLVIDFMTTKVNGLGLDIGKFDQASFVACAAVLAGEGNFLSIAVSEEGVASTDVIGLVEQQIDGTIFIHPGTGLITCRLFREALVDLDDPSILHLTMDDILEHPDWGKTFWPDANDQIRALYSDRTNGYQQVPVITQTVSVAASGGRAAKTKQVQFPLVCNKTLATELASRELSLGSTPRHTMGLVTNRKSASLLPGDVVKVSYTPYTFNAQPFFVTRRRDMSKKDNKVTLQLSQFASPNNAVFTPPEESGFFEQTRDPLPPESALIIDTPYLWSGTTRTDNGRGISPWLDVSMPMVLAQPYSKYQAGWYMQYDPAFDSDTSYLIGPREAGRVGGYCIYGTLNNAIDEFDGITDGKVTIIIDDVTRSFASAPLVSGIAVYALIDDEFFLLHAQALIGTTLTCTGADRAMIDTVKQSHGAGATVRILPLYGQTSSLVIVPPVVYDPNASPTVSPSFKFTGIAYANGVYSDPSPTSLIEGYTPASRHVKPLRPHDTKIGANARSSTPVNVARSSVQTIDFKVRARWLIGYVDPVTGGEFPIWVHDTDWRNVYSLRRDLPQTSPNAFINSSMFKEYDSDNGKYTQYRAMLKDSANVVWNMGNTADNDYKSHTISATIPAGAATGAGLIWVEAYNDYADSSWMKDTLPVNVT